MGKPKVTVLMSVYNNEKHLSDAVNSILNQTFGDFEFLIINDGSTDNSDEILKSYKDSRITIYKNKENIGLAKSLNLGLKKAKGKYIARQDGDDISMPERLKRQVDFLDKYSDYAVVGTFAKVFDENSREVRLWKKLIEDDEIRKFLKKGNCIIHGSAMIRTSFLNNVGFYYESMERSQDYELWLRLSKKYKMANIPEVLYFWRTNTGKVGVKYIRNQQIFVALAKIKNKFLDIEEVTKQFINSTSKYCFISLRFYSIFKIIDLITLKKVNIYRVYNIFYRVRFSSSIKKILKGFAEGKINFDDARLRMKKIFSRGMF